MFKEAGCKAPGEAAQANLTMLSGLLCAAGASLSVFGIEALKAAPAAGSRDRKRPRNPPSAQQDGSSTASNKRPRTDAAAAAADAADRSESATAASPPAGASNEEQHTPGLEAVQAADSSKGEVEPAGSFSFPVLNGGEGNGPSSIKTPAPKPKSNRGKPRYLVAKDSPMLALLRKGLWGVVWCCCLDCCCQLLQCPSLKCSRGEMLHKDQSTAQCPSQLDRVLAV